MENFDIPNGLTDRGKAAAQVIIDFCKQHDLESDQEVFFDPHHWMGAFGDNSLLIVTHANTDASRALSLDGAYERNRRDYSLYDALYKQLASVGVYIEQCTKYYSAVYEA